MKRLVYQRKTRGERGHGEKIRAERRTRERLQSSEGDWVGAGRAPESRQGDTKEGTGRWTRLSPRESRPS